MSGEPENLVLANLRELRGEMQTRFDRIEGRLDRIETRQDKSEAWQHFLDQRLAAWEERQKRLETRLESVEGRLAIIGPAVDTANARLNLIQHEIAELRVAVHTLATATHRHDDQIVDVHRRLAALEAAVGIKP